MPVLLEKSKEESVSEKAELACNRILFIICFNGGQVAPTIKGHTVRNKKYVEDILNDIRNGKIKNKPILKTLAESWDELPDFEKEKFRRIKKT
jgi:hypothetical protein